MKIEIADLTEENLRDAPEWESHPFSCKYCIYWEFPEECVESTTETKDNTIRRKTDWLRRTNELFGNCGKIAYVDGVAVGYAQYAPPEFLPNTANYPAGLPSPDAILISCLFIPQNQFRRLGLGSQLLNSILAELRQRGIDVDFVKRNQAALNQVPVALFTVHMLNTGDNETSRTARLAYLNAIRPLLNGAEEVYFEGKMDFSRLSFLDRMIARMVGAVEADRRDWDKIRNWIPSALA